VHAGRRIQRDCSDEPMDHLLAMRPAGAPSSTVAEHVLQLKHDELPPAAEWFVRHHEDARKVCYTIAMFGGSVCCNACTVNAMMRCGAVLRICGRQAQAGETP
jgi:hypothetical protein